LVIITIHKPIPMCVRRRDGLMYCYDDQGNLIYVGSSIFSPSPKSLLRYPSIFIETINNPYGALNIYLQYGNICIGNNGQLVNYYGVIGRPFFGLIGYSGPVSVPVGVSGVYGNEQTVINNYLDCPCSCGSSITLPVYIVVTWGGTFASGESVSVKLTFNILSQPGSSKTSFTASKTLSASTVGTQTLNIADIIATIAPAITSTGTYTVSSVTAAAASSASSTSVTVTVQLWMLTS